MYFTKKTMGTISVRQTLQMLQTALLHYSELIEKLMMEE